MRNQATDLTEILSNLQQGEGTRVAKQKKNSKKAHLGSPVELQPFKNDAIQVIIETPKGSRNKYAFDEKQRIFKLKRVLPAGMTFPLDFGFVPSTRAEDGDAIDVLVLLDEPAFTGCLLEARLIGVLEAEQAENGETERNDRLIAVAAESCIYAHVKRAEDLGKGVLQELESFFVNYQKLAGKQFRPLGWAGSSRAHSLLQKCRRAA
jgi:inorganic pyrophosphatase